MLKITQNISNIVKLMIVFFAIGALNVQIIILFPIDGFAKVDDPEWMGNTLGMDDKILWPWEPITVQGNMMRCWGRDYTIDQSSFPKSIRSSGKELLIRPVEVTVTSGGRAISWVKKLSQINNSSNATRINFSGKWESIIANQQKINLYTNVNIEYDGLMLYEISVPNNVGKKIESITIDIPIANDIAVYRHRFGWAWKDISFSSGNLSMSNGVIEHTNFVPFLYLITGLEMIVAVFFGLQNPMICGPMDNQKMQFKLLEQIKNCFCV